MRHLGRDLMSGGAFVWHSSYNGRAPDHVVNRARRRQGNGNGNGGNATGGQYTQKTNDDAQAIVLALAQPMQQPLAAVRFPGNNQAIGQTSVIVMNNVGLNTKIIVEITGTIAQAAAETLNRTPLGLANFFSNITLTDLNNVQRVNTTGWHMYLVGTARNKAAYGAAFVNDAPVQIGSNYLVQNAPAAITTAAPFRFFYEIPIAYHDYDLRGAIYAGVTSAQWRLQLTINPNFVVPNTATDSTQAAYKSTTADLGILSNVVIQVYQNYLDQLPRSNGVPVLPAMSLSYNYLLINTTNLMGAAGFDTAIFYPNFRTFLSTIVQFNNAGALNLGTDINYLAIQVANMTYLRKLDPFYTQLQTRNILLDDFPAGHYYLDHRNKPIDTNQFGNTSLVVNPSLVNSGASLNLGYEMLAIQSQAINAGSFPST
jgi:P3 major capsid protein